MNHRYINRIIRKHFGIFEHLDTYNLKTQAVKARFAAMLLCSEELGYSLHRIRRAYGRKSHSGVHHALRMARNLYETDKAFRLKLDAARGDVIKTKESFRQAKQRYNLHYRLRQKGVHVNTAERMISITPDQEDLIRSTGQPRNLIDKHHYLIQYSLL